MEIVGMYNLSEQKGFMKNKIKKYYKPALSSFPQAYCVTFISHDLLVEVEGAILNEAYWHIVSASSITKYSDWNMLANL